MKSRTFTFLFLTALYSFAASNLPTENAGKKPALPFEQDFRAFAAADRVKPPVPGGIVFAGSSIFRQWTNVAEMMAPMPVLNRAFGGSRTGDQLVRFEQVVTLYAPKVIVYYCGSNDLKAGDQPEAIFERFKAFSARVRNTLPATSIIFVSSTRSPDRVAKWDLVNRYNQLVRDYCAVTPQRIFVDVNPALFDQKGQPRLELYQNDKLHFHPPAYVEFSKIIKPVLQRVWDEVASATPTPSRSSGSLPIQK